MLLLLELGKAQVAAGLLVIRVAAQGLLVALYSLIILLPAIGDIAQVIAGFATHLLVLRALGQVGKEPLGLLHRVLVIILLAGDAALTHEGGGKVELGFLACGVGLQGLTVFDLGLGIAFFLIQLVAVAQAHAFLLGHLGRLVL